MKNILAPAILLLSMLTAVSVSAVNNNKQPTGSISIETIEAMPGDIVDVAVTATGFANVSAFDSYITFDNHVLDTVNLASTVINLHPSIASAFHNVINGNTVAVTWISMTPVNIPDGEKLFDLRFIFCDELYPCALNGTASSLNFIENQTHFTTPDLVEIDLVYNNGGIYAANPLRALTINQTGEGMVTVNNAPYEAPLVFTDDVLLSLEALPAPDYEFEGWAGDVNGLENPIDVIMNENKMINVTFTMPPVLYMISFNVTNSYDEEVDDAVIILNGISYDSGHYVFDEIEPGNYSYHITHGCYDDVNGEITVADEDVSVAVQFVVFPGDANGDGVISVLDMITIANHYIGNNPNPFCFHNADINQDGQVNIMDIILLIDIF